MANTKISDLTNAATLTGAEQIPGVQSGGNVKITPSQLRAFVLGGLRVTVFDIGDWNMDADDTTEVTLTGISMGSIRQILSFIRSDNALSPVISNLNIADPASFVMDGAVGLISTSFGGQPEVTLRRRTGGFFDSTDYNSTSFNRGWVIVLHT